MNARSRSRSLRADAIWAAFAIVALAGSIVIGARMLAAGLDTWAAYAVATLTVLLVWVALSRFSRIGARKRPVRAQAESDPDGSDLPEGFDAATDVHRFFIWMAVAAPFVLTAYVVVPERLGVPVLAAGMMAAALFDQFVVAVHPKLSRRPKAKPKWGVLSVIAAGCVFVGASSYLTW